MALLPGNTDQNFLTILTKKKNPQKSQLRLMKFPSIQLVIMNKFNQMLIVRLVKHYKNNYNKLQGGNPFYKMLQQPLLQIIPVIHQNFNNALQKETWNS